MKKKNKKKIVIICLALIILIAGIIVLFNLNGKRNELTLADKKWIDDNKNSMIDIYVMNDLPLFSMDTEDIFLSFLDYFEDETGLTLNKVSYSIGSVPTADYIFKIINESDDIGRNDLLFYQDSFVILGKENKKIQDYSKLAGHKIGVLTNNVVSVTEYITSTSGISITNYENEGLLFDALKGDEVEYVIVPKNMYLDKVVMDKYYVIGNLTSLNNKYVLTLSDGNVKLNNIFSKLYNKWYEHEFSDLYIDRLNSFYYKTASLDDKSKASFLGKKYIYGYVNNVPYEISNSKGLNLEFLKGFEEFANIEFQFKKYNSVKELIKAYEDGKVDIIYNYYDIDSSSSNATIDVYNSAYVLLSKFNNIVTVDSISSLSDKVIYSFKDTLLTDYINNNTKANVKAVSKLSNLLSDDTALVLMDLNTYNYYKNTKLKNYYVVYEGNAALNYNFLIKRDDTNNIFSDVFDYYLTNVNHTEFMYRGMSKMLKNNIFDNVSLFQYAIGAFTLIVLLTIWKKIREKKQKNNEEKGRYIDPLTSLKNRNYLNVNINKWDDNKVYPQGIIVIDLNNLKEINNEFGYHEGDEVIKAAANILINNQLKNTDIMRTDGNEFMIYMVGYDEDQVVLYMRKIYKLMKDLPHEYGATLGHSMITNDIKLVDDAINDAIVEVKKLKEGKEKKKSE